MASALQSLADLPWWTRAWTAQEVIFAPKATMVYGPIIFPMDIWQDAFINFTNHRYSCCESSPMPHNVGNALVASTHDLDDIAIMKAAFETNDRSGWQRSIFRICTQFACRTSTDDHDKVYAFLGLVTDWLERAPIYPDYNISIPDLFTKVTLDLLLASQRLDALINNLEKSRHTNLPSWVLDLTNQNLENINDTRRGMITQYKTTLEPTATIRWLPPRILCVTGFELDTVAAVTDSVGACQKLCSELFLLAGLDRSPQRPYPRGRDYLGAYWRTLCSECICVRGKNEQLGNVTHDYHRVVPGHYDVFVDWAHSRNTSPFYSGPDGDQNGLTDIQKKTFTFVPGFQGRQFDYEPRHLVSIKDFWAAMRNGLRDRKGFITKGGLLGSGPRAMRPGDRVWLLNGGSVPFILRRKTEGWSGDAWEILGYAYVQGIMDGEAVKEGGRVREVYLV